MIVPVRTLAHCLLALSLCAPAFGGQSHQPKSDGMPRLTLHSAVKALCNTPSATTLERSRRSFRTTHLKWMARQHIRFAAAIEESANGLADDVDIRPVTADRTPHDNVAGDLKTTTSDFAELGIALQGFSALEAVLIRVTPEGLNGKPAARNCANASTVARHLSRMSERDPLRRETYPPEDARALLRAVYAIHMSEFAARNQTNRRSTSTAARKVSFKASATENWPPPADLHSLAVLQQVFSGADGWLGSRSAFGSHNETQRLLAEVAERQKPQDRNTGNGIDLRQAAIDVQGRRFVAFLSARKEQISLAVMLTLLAPDASPSRAW